MDYRLARQDALAVNQQRTNLLNFARVRNGNFANVARVRDEQEERARVRRINNIQNIKQLNPLLRDARRASETPDNSRALNSV